MQIYFEDIVRIAIGTLVIAFLGLPVVILGSTEAKASRAVLVVTGR